MTVIGLLVGFWLFLAFMAWVMCRSGARADAVVERWSAERVSARDALESMGAECDVIDFGGWRNGTTR